MILCDLINTFRVQLVLWVPLVLADRMVFPVLKVALASIQLNYSRILVHCRARGHERRER